MNDDQQTSVGSVGEEAAKLFGALQDWARDTSTAHASSATEDLGERLRDLGGHLGHGQDCRYCPVCQAIRVLRETSPEVRQHLATAAGSLAQAISLYVNASGGTTPPERPQRIDLDED